MPQLPTSSLIPAQGKDKERAVATRETCPLYLCPLLLILGRVVAVGCKEHCDVLWVEPDSLGKTDQGRAKCADGEDGQRYPGIRACFSSLDAGVRACFFSP